MPKRISATVVTGFLGAGKTTLIRHLLENCRGRRIALIINEFGDLGVDGSILDGCGISGCDDGGIVELSNGCICCAVADEFAPAMMSLVEMTNPPDHIIIETSGLALPQPLVRAFNWPDLRTRVTVDGVVTVVDGPALKAGQFAHDHAALDRQRLADDKLDHDTPLAELFDDQLACADLVLINKSDLLEPGELAQIKNEIAGQVRTGASVLTAANGAVSPQIVLGLKAGAENTVAERSEIHHRHDATRESLNEEDPGHDHDDFESFIAELPEAACPDRLAEGIRRAIVEHSLLRVKGFASVRGKPMRLVVQAVGPRVNRYFDIPAEGGSPRTTRLVVIGQTGIDRPSVEKALAAAAGG